MVKIALATILIFLSTSFSFGQNAIKSFVVSQAKPISSIEPSNENYTDLQAIGDAIGNARIVMLGEQDHGDAPAFLAKTRLIKYLHEVKGFNVLAFESDFFGANYNWHLVKQGILSVDSFVNQNITPVWSRCSACFPLLKNYLPNTLNTKQPLEITGFDNQIGTHYLLPILDSVLRSLNLPITTVPEYKSETLPLLNTWYNYTKDSSTTDKIINIYTDIRGQLLTKLKADDFWIQTVENLIAQNIQFRNWKQYYWKDMNTRDQQMALNLIWLAQTKYPSEKIIVWAHNYHISKFAGNYPEDFLNKAVTMGTVFTQNTSLANQTYVLGFTSFQGTAGRVFSNPYKIQKPGTNSLESWINPNYNYAFVDFKKYNQGVQTNDNFLMSGSIKGKGHTSHQARWNKIFDGVFFIRNMYPCEKQ